MLSAITSLFICYSEVIVINEDLKILISAILNESNTTSTINKQIKALKLDNINLTASFDFSTLNKSINEAASKIKQANQSTQLRVFDRDKLEKEGVDFIFKSENIINRVKKKFSDLGTVNISNVFDDHGKISGFVAEVTKANNTVEKFQYNLAKIKTGASTQQGYVYSGGLGIDKNAGAELEKTLDFLSRIDTRIKDIYSKATTQTKPLLGDSKEYDVFNNKLEETRSEIDSIRSANETLSKDHKRQIGEMVADLDRYRKEQQNLAYATKDLKPDTFPVAKTQELKELDTLMAKWEASGLFTGEFKRGVLEAKTILESAANPTGLDEYSAKIDLLKEDFKQLSIAATQADASLKLDVNKGILSRDVGAWLDEYKAAPAEIQPVISKVSELQSALETVTSKSDLEIISIQFRDAKTQVDKFYESLSEIEKLDLSKSKVDTSMSNWFIQNPNAPEEAIFKVRELQQALNDVNDKTGVDKIETEFKNLTSSLGATEKAAKKAQDALNLAESKKKFITDIDTAISKIGTNVKLTPFIEDLESIKRRVQETNNLEFGGLKKEFSEVQSRIRGVNEELKQAKANAALNLDKARFTNTVQKWAEDNSRAMKTLGTDIEAILSLIQSADEITLGELKTKLEEIKIQARELGIEGKSFGDSFKQAFSRLTQYFSVAAMLSTVTREVRQMITTVRELDSAMVELKKVTDETDATYAKFFDNASVRASKLGAELKDVITASADFARLGYSIPDAEQLADVAILYKNVGDGINNISEASASVISTMKAFGISAENAMHIVDAFNEVGNNFSISSKGVGDALLRSASSLSAANNTLEESIGLVVAANSVVQDPDVAGTALKTISMRLRNTAGELEELGEDAEGAAESVTKLQTQLLNLTQGRVNIMADNNTFKSTYDILTEISNVWDSLSDKAQADITRLVAGVRQGNVFDALMGGMAEGAKATESAINSQNSALEENAKYLDSISGKVAQYNAALQKLSATTVDTSLVKGIVDGGTTALTILEKIISSLGAMPILITAVVTAMSVKNNAGKNVNMPTIYEVIKIKHDTSMWKSCIYHTGGEPLNCLVKAKAA